MKGFINLLLPVLFLFTACAEHEQSLRRTKLQQQVQGGEETNPALALENAVNRGDLEKISELVDQGVDINMKNQEGLTLPMVAIDASQYASLELVIELGADPEERSTSEPVQDAFEYLEAKDELDKETKDVYARILNQEPLNAETLEPTIFDGIKVYNSGLVAWVLQKGVNPNVTRPKKRDNPLIALLSARRVLDNFVPELQKIFAVLVSHPDIDVTAKLCNSKGRRCKTALNRAQRQVKDNPAVYQPMIDQLKALGATE